MASEEAGGDRGVFWRELYWFVLICIVGVSVAAAVLAPRATRHRALQQFEQRIAAEAARLEQEERELEAAIDSLDHDEFYRDAVYRHVLGVKRRTEEFVSDTRQPLSPGGESLPPPGADDSPDFRWPHPESGAY